MNRTGLLICAATTALTLYACASMAQTTQAASGAQAVAIVGGGGSGGSQRVHTTPDAIAPSLQPSAPCIAVYSGGASVTGFGISLGGGRTDQVCQGGNLALAAAGVYSATGSAFAAQAADVALSRALDLYMTQNAPKPDIEIGPSQIGRLNE